MAAKKASDFDQRILNLFDRYVHGLITRRDFLDGAAKFAVGGMTAAAILESLSPRYVEAQQIPEDDPRLRTEYIDYPSPKGAGTIRAYLCRPAGNPGKLPGIVVIHENRGLNPHIQDVTRRAALAGFLSLGPDALSPLGGYPGNDDDGRVLQRQRDRAEMLEDFISAVGYLQSHAECTGKVGAVGFCFGGGVVNQLAVRLPDLAAGVAFYGSQASAEDVPKIKAPLLLHYAGLDERVNAGWPDYEKALKANNADFMAYMYDNVNHGFHNDTTPRFDPDAATLSWDRTVEFFNTRLR